MTRFICLQPALPTYRVDFFQRCIRILDGNFTVYYSASNLHGLEINHHTGPSWAIKLGDMHVLLPGVSWQNGALSIPIRRGDVLVVPGAPRCVSNLVVLLLARLRGARTIWWGHYWSPTSKLPGFLLRLLLMRFSHSVLFYTDREVLQCKAELGKLSPSKLYGLNNGIDSDAIIANRSCYCAAERGQRLLFIGRFTKKAQIDLLLEALSDPQLQNISLELIGGGPVREELIDSVYELGLEGRVFWHGVLTDEKDIAKVANRCNLFTYPGSVGLSLIHAMNYGLPAVVHANRRHQGPEFDALTPNETGLTFEEGNAFSLAETILEAVSDPERLDEMSRCTLETVENSFNTEDMARRFANALMEMADDPM